MIQNASQKVYEILSQDSTLQGLLPNIKDNSNVWEMRAPTPAESGTFPAVVFRIRSASPMLSVQSLNAFNWFVEIDVIGNTASMNDLWAIFGRIYTLLQDQNISSGTEKAYKCQLDFLDTDYDSNTLSSFILTRWQVISLEMPTSKLGTLS